jgi:hypothetical protein
MMVYVEFVLFFVDTYLGWCTMAPSDAGYLCGMGGLVVHRLVFCAYVYKYISLFESGCILEYDFCQVVDVLLFVILGQFAFCFGLLSYFS